VAAVVVAPASAAAPTAAADADKADRQPIS